MHSFLLLVTKSLSASDRCSRKSVGEGKTNTQNQINVMKNMGEKLLTFWPIEIPQKSKNLRTCKG